MFVQLNTRLMSSTDINNSFYAGTQQENIRSAPITSGAWLRPPRTSVRHVTNETMNDDMHDAVSCRLWMQNAERRPTSTTITPLRFG